MYVCVCDTDSGRSASMEADVHVCMCVWHRVRSSCFNGSRCMYVCGTKSRVVVLRWKPMCICVCDTESGRRASTEADVCMCVEQRVGS